MRYTLYALLALLIPWACNSFCGEPSSVSQQSLAPLDEVIRARRDVWGEAAMRQENGPSYDFFEKLLPPLRYVNAPFLHYPIVLSAPAHSQKARFISNGSGINLSAEGAIGWHDVGFPVTFRVGDREELFGRDLKRLDGPHMAKGYLPIVKLRYREYGCLYEQEVFAAVAPSLADHGAVFVRFKLLEGQTGEVTTAVRFSGRITDDKEALRDTKGNTLIMLDGNWRWQSSWKLLKANLRRDQELHLLIFTKPVESQSDIALTPAFYNEHRKNCIETWEALLDRGMKVETPEAVVNNAYRTMLVGIYSLLRGSVMCYSSNNQYGNLPDQPAGEPVCRYVAEGSDAVRGLMIWGFLEDAFRMMPPILRSVRAGLMYHRAGIKLQMLNHYYWLTRDTDGVNSLRNLWTPEVERIITGREADSGLFPRERYCGDVGTQVYNLRSNANAWRGLRDTGGMLEDMGRKREAGRALRYAEEFRSVIIEAAKKSEYQDVEPPFIPIALFGEEKPHEVLTANKEASYYNLVAPYTIASGIFGVGAERERWMIEYLQQHGGFCMGMIRSRPNSEFWVQKSNVNDLYTRRYVITLLQNDDVERALVSFYGKLAQGCTRNTFIDGEGTCLVPMDEFGRRMYLPPNSAANSHFLWMLRYMLIQDWDMNDDGKPDTLRLMFATPRRWLADDNTIEISNAPTAFGRVSCTVNSHLSRGEVLTRVLMPPRPAERALCRARVPEGWRIISATVDGTDIPVDSLGTVDISGRQGRLSIKFSVQEETINDATSH